MKSLVLFSILWLGISLNAEENKPSAQFSGLGQILARPEFIKLNLTVHSECYASPAAAQEATDKIVKKIYDYLQTLKSPQDPFFKIIVKGGYTSAYSRWFNNKEICRQSFQKNSDIVLSIGFRADFDKTFAKLQSYVLNNFKQTSSFAEEAVSQSYVQIGSIGTEISRSLRLELGKKARDMAMKDAISNFKSAIKSCPSLPWKVVSIKEHNENYYTPRSYAIRGAAKAAEIVAPLSFDDLIIEAKLEVTFEWKGALCESPAE